MGAWNGDHRRRDSDRAAPVPADTATARLGGWRVSVGDLQTRDGHHPGPAPADVSSDRSGARGTLRLRLRLPGRAPTSAVGDGPLTDWLGRTPASESSSGRARRSPRVRLITPTVIRNDAAATARQTRSCEAARPRGPALTGGPSPGGPMSSVSDNWTTTPAPGRLSTHPAVVLSFVDGISTSEGCEFGNLAGPGAAPCPGRSSPEPMDVQLSSCDDTRRRPMRSRRGRRTTTPDDGGA